MDQNKLEQNALIEKAIVGILGIPRISANSNVSRSPTHEHSKEFDPNEHKSSGKLLGNSQMGGTTPSTTSSAHEHLESSLPSEHQINGELMDNARSDSEPAGLAHNMQLSENASYIFEPATAEEINLGTDIIEILVDMPMCNVEESLLDSDYANILEVSDNSIRPDTTLSLSENSEPSSQCVSSANQFNLVPTEYVTVEDIESFNNTLTFNSYCGDNCYLPSSSKNCLNDSSETIYSSEILVNGTSTPEKGSNQTEVEVTYEERNTSSSDNSVSIISNDGLIELPEVWDKGHDDTEVDVIIEDNNSPNLLKSDSLKIFYEMNAQLIASDNEESAIIGDKYIPILNNKTNDDKDVSAEHEDKDMPKLLAVTEIPPVQEIYANPPILKPQVPASKNDVQPKTSVVGVVHPFNRASTATKSQPFSDTTVSQQVAKNQSKLETIEDDKLKQNIVRIRVRTSGNQQTSLNVLVKNFPPEVQVKQGISQNYQRKGYNCNKNEKNPVDENLIYSKHSKKVIENNIFSTGNAKSDESKSNFNNVHWYSVDYETCNTKASLKGNTGMKVTFSSLPDLSIDNDAEQGPVNNFYGEKSSAKTNVQSTRKFSGPLLRSQQRLDLSKEIPPIRNKSGKNAIKNILALGNVKVDIKNDDSAIKLHHSEGKLNNAKTAKHYGITDVQLISSSNLPVDRKSTNTRESTKKNTNTNLASIAENKVRTRTSHRRNSLINNSLLKEHDYFATKKEVSKSKITELVSLEEKIISERSSLSGNKERSVYQDSVDHQLISSIFSKNFCSKNVIVERVYGYESPSISTLPSKDHSSSSNFNSFQAVDSPLNAFDTDSSIHSYIDNSTDTATKEALLSLSDLELYNDINELKSTEDFRKLDSDLRLNSSNIVSNEEKRYPEHEDFPIEPEYHENGQAQCLILSNDAAAIPLPSSNTTSIEYPKKNKPRQKLNSKKNSIPSGDSCIPEMTKSSRVSKPLTKSTRPAPKKSYKKIPTSETLILDSNSYNLSFCDPSALSFSSEGAGAEDRSNFANSYDSSSCLSYSMNGPLQGHSNLQTSPVDFFVRSDTLTKSPQDTEVRISESPDIEGGIISPEVILTVLDGTISNSITEDNGETGEILETNNDNLITKVDSTIENMISYDTEISVGDSVTDELCSVETAPIDNLIIVTEEAVEHKNIVIQKLTTQIVGNEEGQIEEVVNVPPLILDNNTQDATIADEQLLSCQNQTAGNKLKYEEVVRYPSNCTENLLQSENSKNGKTAEVSSCKNNIVDPEVFVDKECLQWNKNIPFSIESSSLSEEIVIEPTTTESATETLLKELVESENGKSFISNENISCSNTNQSLADSRLRRKISRKRKIGKYRAFFKRHLLLKTNCAKKMNAQKQSSKRLSLYEDKNQKNIQHDNIADSVVANSSVENYDKIIETPDVQQSTSKLPKNCGLFDGDNSATENKECTITDSVNSVNDALLEDNKKYISGVSVLGTSTIQTKSPCDKINDTPLKSNYIVSGKRIIRIQQKKPILPLMDNSEISQSEKSSQLSAPTCSSNSEILVKNLPNKPIICSKLSRDNRQGIIPRISNIVRRNKSPPLCTVELRSETDNQSVPQELKLKVNVLDTCKISKPLPPLIKVDKNTVAKLNKNKSSPVTHENLLEEKSVNEFKSLEEGITLCKLDNSAGNEVVCKVYKDGAKSLNRSNFLSNIKPPSKDNPIPKISKIVRGDECLSTSLDSSYRVLKKNTITDISIAHKTLSAKGKPIIDCNTVSLSSTKRVRDKTDLLQFKLNHIKPSSSSSSSLDSTFLPAPLAEEVMSNTNLSKSKNLSESKTYVKCLAENTDVISLTPSTSPTKEHIKPVSLASSSKIVNDTTSIAPDLSAANITISKEPLITTMQCSEPLQEPDCIVKEAEGRAALPTEIPQLTENLQRGTTITQLLPTNDNGKVKNTSQGSIASHSSNLSNEQVGKVMINNKDQDLYKNEISNKRKRSTRICDATVTVDKSLTNHLDDESTCIVKPSQSIEQNNIFNPASTSKNSKKLNKNTKPMWSTRSLRSKTVLEKLPDSKIYCEEQYNKKYKCLPLNIELSLVDQCINKTKKLQTEKYVESCSTNSIKRVSYNSKNKLGETSGVLAEASCSKFSSVNLLETELNNEITNRYHEGKRTGSERTVLERGISALDSVYSMIATNVSEQDKEFIDKSKEVLPIIPSIKNTTDVNLNEEQLLEPAINTHKTFANINEAPLKIPSLNNTVFTEEQPSDFVVTMERDINNSKFSSPAINSFDTIKLVSCNVENKLGLHQPAVHDVTNNTVMMKQSTHTKRQIIHKEQPSIEVEHSVLTLEEELPFALVKEVPSPICTVGEKLLIPVHLQDLSTHKSECVIEGEISPTLPNEQPSIEVEPSNAIVVEVPSITCTVEEEPLTGDHAHDVTTDKSQCVITDDISQTLPNEQPSIDKSEFFIEDRTSQTIPIELHSIAEPTSEFPVEKEPSVPIVIEVPSVICAVVEEPLTQVKEQAIRTDKSQGVIEIDISQTIPKEQPLLDVEPSNARVKELPSPIYTVEEKSLTPDHDLDISSDQTHCLIEDRTSQTVTIVPTSIVTKPTLGFPVEIVPSNAIVEEVTSLKFTVEEETLTPVRVLNVSNDKSQSVIEDEISPTLPNEQLLNDVEPPNAKVVEVPSSICTEEQETLTQDHVHDVSNDKSQNVIEDEISTTLPKGQSSIEVEPSSAIVKEVPSPLCTVVGKPLTLDLVYDVSFDKSQCSIEVESSNTIVEEVPSSICTVEEGLLTPDHIHDVSTGKSQCAIIDEISLTLPQEQPSNEVEPSNAIVEEVPSTICTVEEEPLTGDHAHDVSTGKSQCAIDDEISPTLPKEQPSIEVEPSNAIVEEVPSPKFTVEEKPLTPDRLYDITTDSSQNEQGDGISQFIPGEQSSIEVKPYKTIVEEVPSSICTVEEGPLTPDHIHDVSTGKSQCAIIDEISLTLPQEQPSNEVEPSNAIVEEVPSTICTVEEEPLTGDHAHDVTTGKSQCAIDDEISLTLPKEISLTIPNEQPSIEVEPSNAIVEEVPSPKFTVEEIPFTPDALYDLTTDMSENVQGDGISQIIPREQSSIEIEPSNAIVEEVPSSICTVEERPLTPDHIPDVSTSKSQYAIDDEISPTLPKEQPSIEVQPSSAIVEEVPSPKFTVEEKPLTPDHLHDVTSDKSHNVHGDSMSLTIPKEQRSMEVEPSNAIVDQEPFPKCTVGEETLSPDHVHDVSSNKSQYVFEDDFSMTLPKEQLSIEVEPSNAIVDEVYSSICTVEEEPLIQGQVHAISNDRSQCVHRDVIPLIILKERRSIDIEPTNSIVKQVPSPICTVEGKPLTLHRLNDVTTVMSQSVQGDRISHFIPKEQPSFEVEPSNAIVEEVPSSICTVEEKPLTPYLLHDLTSDKSHNVHGDSISPTFPKEQLSIKVEPSNVIIDEVPSMICPVEEEPSSHAIVKEVPSPLCTVHGKPLTLDHVYDVGFDKSQCVIYDEISPTLPKEQPSIEVEPSNAIVEEVPSPKFTVEEKPLTPDPLYDVTTDMSENVQGDGISQFIPREQSSIEIEPSNAIVEEVPSSICTVEERPLTPDHIHDVSTSKSQYAIDDEISPTLPKEQLSIEVQPSSAIVEEVPSTICTVEEILLTPDPLYDVTTDMSENVQGDGISQFIPREQSSIEIEPSKAIVEEVPSSICTVEERPLTQDHIHDVSTGKSQYAIDDEISLTLPKEISPTLPKEQPSIEVETSNAIVEEVPSPKFTVEEKPLTPDHLHDVTSDKSHNVHGDSISQTLLKEQLSIEVEPSNVIVKEVPSKICTVEEESLTPDHVHDVSSDKSQCVIEYEISPTLPKELPSIDVVSSNAIVKGVPSPICTVVEEPLTADHVLDISSDMLQCVHGDVISLTIPKEHPSIDVEPSDAKAEEMPSYKCTDEDNTAKCTFEEKALTPDDVHVMMSIVKARSFIEDKTSQTFPKIQPSIEVEPTSGFPVEKEPSVKAISTDKSQCVFEDEISLTIPKELPSIDVESSNARVEEVHSVRRTVEEKPLTPNNVNVISILNEVSDDKPQSVLSQMVPKLQSSDKDEPFKQNFEEGADRYIVENDILNSKVVEQSSTALNEVQVSQSQNVKEFLAVKDTLVIVDGSVVSESEVSAQTLIGKLPSSKSVIKDSQPEPVIIDQKLQPTNDNILVQKGAGDGSLDSLNDGYIQDSQTGSLDLTTTKSNGEIIAADAGNSLSEKTSVEVNGIILGSGDESYSFYTNSVELDMSYRYSLKCYKPKYSPRRAKPKTAKESDLNKNDIQSSRVISRIKHSRMNANANEKDISQESYVSKSNQKSLKRKIKSGSIGPQTKRSSHSKDFINKRISNTLTDTSRDECVSVIHGKFKKSLSNSTRKRKLVDSDVEEPPTKIPNRATHFENRLRQVRRQPKPNTESHYKKSLQKSKIFTDKEIRVGNSKSDTKNTSGLPSDPVKIWPFSINETNANSKSYLRKLMRKCGVRVVYIPLHVYRTMCPNEIINTEVKEGYKAIYCKETSRNERSPSSSMREEEELQQRVLKNWKVRAIKLQRAKIQKTSENSITARNISVNANIDSNNKTELNVNNIKEQQVNTNNEEHISNQFISRKKSKSGIETDKFQYPNLSNDSLSKSSGEVRYNISELQETSQEHVPHNRHSIEEPSRKIIKLSRTETIYTPSTEVNRHRQIEIDTNPYNDIFNKSYNENKEFYKDEDSWDFLGFQPCLVHGVTLEAPQETCSCSMNETSGLFYRNYEKKLRLLGLPNSSDLMFPSPNNFPSLMPPPESQTYDLRHIGDPLPSQSNCNFDPIGKMTDSNTTHSESSSQLNFSSKNNKDAMRSRVRRVKKNKERRHAVYLCHSGFGPCPPECKQRRLARMWQKWGIPFSELYPEVAPQEKQKVEENGMLNLPAAPIIDHPLEDVSQPGPSGLNRVPNQPPPQEDPNVCSGKATCRCYDCQDLDEDYGR